MMRLSGLVLVSTLALPVLAGCGTASVPAPTLAPMAASADEDELDALRAYPVADLLGVGPVYAERLSKAGVRNTDQLLSRTSTRTAREKLAREADIPYGRLLPIAQSVEVMRIQGIGVRQANLLQAVG